MAIRLDSRPFTIAELASHRPYLHDAANKCGVELRKLTALLGKEGDMKTARKLAALHPQSTFAYHQVYMKIDIVDAAAYMRSKVTFDWRPVVISARESLAATYGPFIEQANAIGRAYAGASQTKDNREQWRRLRAAETALVEAALPPGDIEVVNKGIAAVTIAADVPLRQLAAPTNGDPLTIFAAANLTYMPWGLTASELSLLLSKEEKVAVAADTLYAIANDFQCTVVHFRLPSTMTYNVDYGESAAELRMWNKEARNRLKANGQSGTRSPSVGRIAKETLTKWGVDEPADFRQMERDSAAAYATATAAKIRTAAQSSALANPIANRPLIAKVAAAGRKSLTVFGSRQPDDRVLVLVEFQQGLLHIAHTGDLSPFFASQRELPQPLRTMSGEGFSRPCGAKERTTALQTVALPTKVVQKGKGQGKVDAGTVEMDVDMLAMYALLTEYSPDDAVTVLELAAIK